MSISLCVFVCVCLCSQIIDPCRMNLLFTCDKETLCRHNSTHTSLGNVKDVDPKVLQGVFNFIDMNTQVPEQVEVPEDVKQDFGMSPTCTIDNRRDR